MEQADWKKRKKTLRIDRVSKSSSRLLRRESSSTPNNPETPTTSLISLQTHIYRPFLRDVYKLNKAKVPASIIHEDSLGCDLSETFNCWKTPPLRQFRSLYPSGNPRLQDASRFGNFSPRSPRKARATDAEVAKFEKFPVSATRPLNGYIILTSLIFADLSARWACIRNEFLSCLQETFRLNFQWIHLPGDADCFFNPSPSLLLPASLTCSLYKKTVIKLPRSITFRSPANSRMGLGKAFTLDKKKTFLYKSESDK